MTKWQVEDIGVHVNILQNKEGVDLMEQKQIAMGIPKKEFAQRIVDEHNNTIDELLEKSNMESRVKNE